MASNPFTSGNLLKLVAGSLTLLALGATAEAAELKLTWTSADSKTDPFAVGAHAFADALKEVSGGKHTVALFPNRQLGEEKEMVEALRFGTLDMGIVTNASVANLEPKLQLLDMPFLFKSSEQAHGVLDGPVGDTLKTAVNSKGIVVLGFMEAGFRTMINNSKPVLKPADVVGVKYRTMQNPVYIQMFQSLGGSPIPMAWGEVFTALQQGTVDGMEIPMAVVNGNKFYEVVKYLSLTNHTYTAIELLISKKVLAKLDAETQKTITEAGRLAVKNQRMTVQENEKDLLKSLAAAGMKINEVPDMKPFRDAVMPVYDRFRGPIGAELLDQALAAVK
jgi:tripartite ATP-independent transporter DctP family solute receptor